MWAVVIRRRAVSLSRRLPVYPPCFGPKAVFEQNSVQVVQALIAIRALRDSMVMPAAELSAFGRRDSTTGGSRDRRPGHSRGWPGRDIDGGMTTVSAFL